MLEAMDETTKRKFLDGSSSSSSLSSSFHGSSIGGGQEEEEDLEEDHHTDHLELAEKSGAQRRRDVHAPRRGRGRRRESRDIRT